MKCMSRAGTVLPGMGGCLAICTAPPQEQERRTRRLSVAPCLTVERSQSMSNAARDVILRESLSSVFQSPREQMSTPCLSRTPSVFSRTDTGLLTTSRTFSRSRFDPDRDGVHSARRPNALRHHNLTDEAMKLRRRWSYSPPGLEGWAQREELGDFSQTQTEHSMPRTRRCP